MANPFEILPGTAHSRYALPIEYLPSRDFRPRWGFSRPPIPGIVQWIEGNDASYRAFLQAMRVFAPEFGRINLAFDHDRSNEPAWLGVPITPFDSAALYTMVRTGRPRRYLEIGSGVTTCFARRASVDGGHPMHITSIDPEPRAGIDAICDDIVRQGLEQVDIGIFGELEPGDILFMDGSHRAFMNSDVTVFFVDVLPIIKPGVIIHIHDIGLPYDYTDDFKYWYWNEQYMLATYILAAPDRLEPILPTCYICRSGQFNTELSKPFTDLGPESNDGWNWGGSMWFTRRAVG